MAKQRILLQLDSDPQPSVFDAVVAVDAGVEHLLARCGVTVESVRDLVHGAMFTRGPDDLRQTAIFIGGSDVAKGEALLAEIRATFFGPLRVSVMLDSNGANTTAAAAVIAAEKHVRLADAAALVLGGTGPVGERVARLLAREGANVRVGSRSSQRAAAVCEKIAAAVSDAQLTPHATDTPAGIGNALEGVTIVISAGGAGVQLLSAAARTASQTIQVAVDLNAVPPVGLEGIDPQDRGTERDTAACYGAIGVGGTKMKIHKAALRRLFTTNDAILDAEEIFEIGRSL